jgi:hypothetical protein
MPNLFSPVALLVIEAFGGTQLFAEANLFI